MPVADWLGAQFPGGFEWIILLIIIAIILLFGPKKLPELARSIGRAWGELRRGKMDVERQIKEELQLDEAQDFGAKLRASARELGIDSTGKKDSDLKLEIARRVDTASDDKIVSVSRILGASEGGASPSRLRELIIRTLGI
jgi:sec-independent protein translocase protein TatA